MSFTSNPALVPDRDNLPLKKRDQRRSSSPPPPPPPQQQQQCDDVTFKAPYPYKDHSRFKTKYTSPFQPIPKRVPPLYQPWMQTHTSGRSKPQVLSAFKEHHGWAHPNPLHLRWDHYQHHGHLPGTHAAHPGLLHRPASLVNEGFQRWGGGYSWEQLKPLRDVGFHTERQSNGKNKGPYVRRKLEYIPRAEEASPPSLSTRLPHSPHEEHALQLDAPHKSIKPVRHLVSGHSFIRDNKQSETHASAKEEASRSPSLGSSEQASPSSSNPFPWLLPHFMAGSLIELRDGRLRKVEHLQTEDFLLGSLACPDLHLSCCTVQSISPSTSSSISRLLILLHDQQSQELVDVYMEYPFFVHGRGWSSCSPQRTARLCGLQCHQLSVGDVCLALTPVSAAQCPLTATLQPDVSPGGSDGGCGSQKVTRPEVPPRPQGPAGGKKTAVVRRRHHSAPELRGPTDYTH